MVEFEFSGTDVLLHLISMSTQIPKNCELNSNDFDVKI